MFPLLRYFSFASLISLIFTTLLLGLLHHQIERNQLLDIGESNHVALTQTLANALLPSLRHLTETARTLDTDSLRTHPEMAALRPQVLDAMRNTHVVKVKLYELSGRVIFSTDPTQIGNDGSQNLGFISALRGQPKSELTHRERFSAFDREIVDRDLLSSYVGLRTGEQAPVEGVLEVYSDVTDWVEHIDRQARVVSLATVLSLCLLYAVLYFIVRRADSTIRNQYGELQRSEEELRIAATSFETQQSMVVTDARGIIMRVNHAFSEATGYPPEEAIGESLKLLKSGRHDDAFYAAIWREIEKHGAWSGEIWNRRKNGEIYPDWLTISAVYDSRGLITHYVAVLFDITQRKADEEKVRLLAFHDPLTLLPNRRLLEDRLQHALATSVRDGRHGALMFIDLDRFKEVNDSLGHDIGDMLLQSVAQRLKGCVRECDTVARWGGDEFIVMLEGLDEQAGVAVDQTQVIGDKILAELNRPYQLGELACSSTSSIGATLFQGRETSVSQLLKQADTAMYQAKTEGGNRVVFSDGAPAA